MKTRYQILVMLLAVLTASPLRAQQNTPVMPVGNLSAFPTIVQAGTHPTLTWDITLPESVLDIVEIIPPGTISPQTELTMDVRILGASVKAVWTNQYGQVTNWEWVPTEALISYNGGSYTRIFYDTHNDVNPSNIVHNRTVAADSTINFGGRYYWNNRWSNLFTSTNGQHNVVALINGDTPPTTTPLYQQPSIESFILPYLDNAGKIKLGPRDVIYLMELTHTNRNDGGFDLQDLAILVSFQDPPVAPPSSGSGWINSTTVRSGNTTTTGAFSTTGLHLSAKSTRSLSNVVLAFADGTHQKFEGLSGKTGIFQGTGSNVNKAVVGAWIKSGNNQSGAGPGYGAWHPNG